MKTNAEYIANMKTQMKKWDADIDALAAKSGKASDKASDEARAAYHEYIKDARASRDAAQKTFQEMQVATQAAGEQMRVKMGVAWETMQKALAKVSQDLRK
jgi:hypothetical protein